MSKRKPKTPVIKVQQRHVLPPIDGLTVTVRTDLRGKILPNTRYVRMELLIPRNRGGYDSYTQAFQVKP